MKSKGQLSTLNFKSGDKVKHAGHGICEVLNIFGATANLSERLHVRLSDGSDTTVLIKDVVKL